MDLRTIANSICDQADDFLDGVTKRAEAKAGVAELVTIQHPGLSPAERMAVTEEVMATLEREGFFDRAAGGEESSG